MVSATTLMAMIIMIMIGDLFVVESSGDDGD